MTPSELYTRNRGGRIASAHTKEDSSRAFGVMPLCCALCRSEAAPRKGTSLTFVQGGSPPNLGPCLSCQQSVGLVCFSTGGFKPGVQGCLEQPVRTGARIQHRNAGRSARVAAAHPRSAARHTAAFRSVCPGCEVSWHLKSNRFSQTTGNYTEGFPQLEDTWHAGPFLFSVHFSSFSAV